MTRRKIDFDEAKAEHLWLEGKSDAESAQIMEINIGVYANWRRSMGYPDNKGLFAWQEKLGKKKLAQIPERYRRAI